MVRLDRLARSVSHLLEVIETLEARKAHFRSLRDPIDTSTPQGIFSLQVLGAVAQLERSLISERTRAGIKAAKARGKKPGNPGMRERRPEAIRKIALAREKAYLDELIAGADQWMPTVRRMRPHHPWEDVVRVLHDNGQEWTVARLRRAVGKLVAQRMADPALLRPAPRKNPADRLMTLIAGIAMADPSLSLRDIGAQLERMRERTPRGGLTWSASSVKSNSTRRRSTDLRSRQWLRAIADLLQYTVQLHQPLRSAYSATEFIAHAAKVRGQRIIVAPFTLLEGFPIGSIGGA